MTPRDIAADCLGAAADLAKLAAAWGVCPSRLLTV